MNLIKPLTLAIALMLGTSYAADADAARRDKKEEAEVTYPDATREEPKEVTVSSRLSKDIGKLQEVYEESGREEEAIALAEKVLANEKANPFDRGLALLFAGGAAYNLGDDARAESYLSRVLEANVLANEQHYNAMRTLGAVYYNSDQYDKAAQLFTRMLAETKLQDAELYKLLGASYYNADKFAEAIEPLKTAISLSGDDVDTQIVQSLMAAYAETNREAEALVLAEQIVAKKPDDVSAIMNAVTLYTNLDQPEKGVALLESALQRGLITKANDYKRLYAAYFQLDREAEAARLIEDGIAKNILPSDGQTYFELAQAHYFADNIPAAIAAAQKGAPLSQDGKLSLLLAQILNQEGRSAESIAAAKAAIAKGGLDKPGEAWMVIAAGERYSDNLAGARAAYAEAAKDPSTRSQAQQELAKIGR